MSSKKVVIIGGVAAGPKTAARIMRLDAEADVTLVERGEILSYAGCGLPYYVSGAVKKKKELLATPVGVVRDPVFFQKVKRFRVLNGTEAIEIDRSAKTVRVKTLASGEETELPYDELVLATGASPIRPPIEGLDKPGVYALHGVEDAEGIRHLLAENRAHDVVIIGGGLIGVEATEALVERGSRVTMVEATPQILGLLDEEMAAKVEQHMETHGVKILKNTLVKAIKGDGKVERVVTSDGELAAEMVILAAGVRPSVDLARAAGLEIGELGGIRIDDRQRTSDPHIYAVGDCVESHHRVSGQPAFVPLGSTANKQGRVAANNICGIDDRFPGITGSAVCKVFDFCVTRTGLTEREARQKGIDAEIVLVPGPDKAHYMPGAKVIFLKLVADRKSRKLLGAQAVGPGAGDKRMDVCAMALAAEMTVDQLAHADLCYAPPYSAALDNVITAANVMRNKLDGQMAGITAREVHQWQTDGRGFVLLDVRTEAEYRSQHLPGSTLIPLGELRSRIEELPRDKDIVTFCKISLRGYEAARILKGAGLEKVKVLDGGLAMWPYETES